LRAAFVTHAGGKIGGGHLYRCYALSQALEERGAEVSWALNAESEGLAASLGLRRVNLFDNPFEVKNITAAVDADVVVVDSYEPGESFFRDISTRHKLAAVSDFGGDVSENYASALINYSVGASDGLYSSRPSCRYLLGPRYALLRRDFWNMRSSDGGYVLFVPGAADVANAAETIIGWWREDLPELIIACGSLVSGEARNSLVREAGKSGNISVMPSPENFAEIMAGARIVICTASVTAYEALALRKRLAVFTVADNQLGLGERLEGIGAACNLGSWSGVTQNSIEAALAFEPDRDVLRNLVNPRGAVECAGELIGIDGVAPDEAR
jgi:spore coat polysaccharide biosynthesis predicted glycosyltransferase SpsG